MLACVALVLAPMYGAIVIPAAVTGRVTNATIDPQLSAIVDRRAVLGFSLAALDITAALQSLSTGGVGIAGFLVRMTQENTGFSIWANGSPNVHTEFTQRLRPVH